MSKLMWILALLCFACSVSATPVPEGRFLLVDDAVDHVSLVADHRGFQSPDIRPQGGFAWEPEPFSTGKKLAIATAAVLLMGPSGAGYASAQEQGAVLQARRQWLDPLLRITRNDNALRSRLLAVLRASLADAGAPVDRVVISPEAAGAVLSRAARDESLAVVVRARHGSIVSLTADDRRLVVEMWAEGYERPGTRFRKRSGRFPLRYVSGPLDGERPIEAWSKDNAAIFWSELERGVRALVAASAMHVDEDVSDTERVAITHTMRGEEFRGRLIRRAGDIAYIAEKNGGLMIVHDQPIPSAPGAD
jgi:hypothetical protein